MIRQFFAYYRPYRKLFFLDFGCAVIVDLMESVVREGSFDPAVTKLLASKFVCVYVDTNTVSGRTLADSLQIASQGIVISDGPMSKV